MQPLYIGDLFRFGDKRLRLKDLKQIVKDSNVGLVDGKKKKFCWSVGVCEYTRMEARGNILVSFYITVFLLQSREIADQQVPRIDPLIPWAVFIAIHHHTTPLHGYHRSELGSSFLCRNHFIH